MAASAEVKLSSIHLMMPIHTHMTSNLISISQLSKFELYILFLRLTCACWPEQSLDTGVVHGCERTKTQEVRLAHSCMGVFVWFHM